MMRAGNSRRIFAERKLRTMEHRGWAVDMQQSLLNMFFEELVHWRDFFIQFYGMRSSVTSQQPTK